jgi:hypothetical protein
MKEQFRIFGEALVSQRMPPRAFSLRMQFWIVGLLDQQSMVADPQHP